MKLKTNQVNHVGKYVYQLKVNLMSYPSILKLIDIPIEILKCVATSLKLTGTHDLGVSFDDEFQKSE